MNKEGSSRPNILDRVRNQTLSERIKNAETDLGIHTSADRLREASLLVDRKFVQVAVISGKTDGLEQIFGAQEWLGWLQARNLAKAYKGLLTKDFIIDAARAIQQKDWAWVRKVPIHGSNDGSDHPVLLSLDQSKQVQTNFDQGNSFAQFIRVRSSSDGEQGYFLYPSANTPEAIEQDILRRMDEVCIWYNEQRAKPDHNPILLAAQLEQKLVSIHPFIDGNGRVSRLLMNWSLESEGQPPSILEDPDNDLFTSPQSFATEVMEGQKRYNQIHAAQKELEQLGIENPALLFGLDEEHTFYHYIYRLIHPAPSIQPNWWGEVNHADVETFLLSLTEEKNKFDGYMRKITKNRIKPGDIEYEYTTRQGGLIPLALMEFYRRNNPEDSKYVLAHYFHGEKMYRGGRIEKKPPEEQLLRMFVEYFNVGTGYRALGRAGLLDTDALKQVYPRTIVESHEYYNLLITMFYLQTYYRDIYDANKVLFSGVTDEINTHLLKHIMALSHWWESPFVSYSAIRDGAREYTGDIRWEEIGLLITAALPTHGVIQTFKEDENSLLPFSMSNPMFGKEYELLIAGAVIPYAIDAITAYQPKGVNLDRPLIKARKIFNAGNLYVELTDYSGKLPIQKMYVYAPDSQSFTKISEVELNNSSINK